MPALDARLRAAARTSDWERGVVHRCAWCGRVRGRHGAYAAPVQPAADVVVTDGMCSRCAATALRQLAARAPGR